MVASIAAALAAELLAGHMEATKAQLSHSAHVSSGSGGQEINDRCPWCNSPTHHDSGCLSAARHRAGKPERLPYTPFPGPDMCLSDTAMQLIAQVLPAAKKYTLMVSPLAFISARHLIRQMAAEVADNPFAPWINLVEDDAYTPEEFSLIAWDSGQVIGHVGSKGC